mmetsp:Transcript_21119/g.39023  ORF Transcript_21119/g.39023 Transcript_21119/m.39023 type:complete len:638 (+) Transcript_21119:41-1954(+)
MDRSLTLTRLAKERELLKASQTDSYTLNFPEQARQLEVKTDVEGHIVTLYVHLPEDYPLKAPKVSIDTPPELTSLTLIEVNDEVLSSVLGESWIPAISLVQLVHRLVLLVRSRLKKRRDFPLGSVMRSVLAVVLLSLVVRSLIAVNPHSGQDNAPKFGDYEAQRHWMELTYNLDPRDWYRNTTQNDLQYWGLDYPPLTARHSQLLGYVSNFIDPASMALETSRGYLTPAHKLFMRLSVAFSELLTFVPAVLWFIYTYYRYIRPDLKLLGAFVLLCSPALVLVDHGHFQYNSVMLGLSVAAFTAVIRGNTVFASIMFTLALNFKQMSLYYSLPMFFAIITKAHSEAKESLQRLRSVNQSRSKQVVTLWIETVYTVVNAGVVFIVLTLILWYPYLTSLNEFLQVLRRIFPVERGVFEDKVATFWCVASVIIKFKAWFAQSTLVSSSALLTLAASMPSIYLMVTRRSFTKHFLYCVCSVSLAFFLLSYHVHEKSILLPLVPISIFTLVECPQVFLVMNLVSCFSIYPLLVKDDLQLAYFALTMLFALIAKSFTDEVSYFSGKRPSKLILLLYPIPFLHLTELIPQPAAFPYLFDLTVAAYSFACFAIIWVFMLRRQYKLLDLEDSDVYLEQKLVLKPKMP